MLRTPCCITCRLLRTRRHDALSCCKSLRELLPMLAETSGLQTFGRYVSLFLFLSGAFCFLFAAVLFASPCVVLLIGSSGTSCPAFCVLEFACVACSCLLLPLFADNFVSAQVCAVSCAGCFD